jgi:hypothetical protein
MVISARWRARHGLGHAVADELTDENGNEKLTHDGLDHISIYTSSLVEVYICRSAADDAFCYP